MKRQDVPSGGETAGLKKTLRAAAAARRDALPSESRAGWSASACAAAAGWLADEGIARPGAAIMAYAAFRSELDPARLVEWAWQTGMDVILPRIDPSSRSMELYAVRSWNELSAGAYGIREPEPAKARLLAERELPAVVFVPGLAFDSAGGRLGYGGGYYDRFQSRALGIAAAAGGVPPLWAGLAFEAQRLDSVPMEAHDARMNLVITEQGVCRIRSAAN
ncbi:5-formyltetrahydrofolate cyclo-ligase [Paenibacillus humicola]|uniref:5-formyltetrahydrofolate cyclo-ligase n=1 Tax=Paenibacillus humicola TaxID=3110540 RepID=UPI00237A7018|nr:5-formyltetrahydrofolate cyclo-ligase [Paenibacillus humicola]